MDIIAGVLELFGSWIIGNKSQWGFILNIVASCFWIHVACTREVYGLLIVVIPMVFINGRNYLKWTNQLS